MGAWGYAILSDDTARDVYDAYLELYDDGLDHVAIRQRLELDFRDSIGDPDDGPVFWLALVNAQWQCGALQPDVMLRVTETIKQRDGLELWQEQGTAAVRKREQVLDAFLAKLKSP